MATTKYTSSLHDKRILVLGGTSGLGFCVAEASVEYGAVVIVASSSQAKIDAAVSRIQTSYPDKKSRISGHVCDLSSDDVEANLRSLLVHATNSGANKLDHIVHTAGNVQKITDVAEITPEEMHEQSKVRLVSAVMLAKVIPKYIHNVAASSLTFTSGVVTTKPLPGWTTRIIWSGAVEKMARGLAVDLKPVRVNCISPGAVATELSSMYGDSERVYDMYKKRTLTGNIGQPEDIAEAYLYCMKDPFITGARIDTNGGFLYG